MEYPKSNKRTKGDKKAGRKSLLQHIYQLGEKNPMIAARKDAKAGRMSDKPKTPLKKDQSKLKPKKRPSLKDYGAGTGLSDADMKNARRAIGTGRSDKDYKRVENMPKAKFDKEYEMLMSKDKKLGY